MSTVTIKRHDTMPYVKATLKNADGTVIALQGAAVKFIMVSSDPNGPEISGSAVVTDEDGGMVEYRWQPGDTDVAGGYKAEFEITFADNRVLTVPTASYIPVAVVKDLG